MADAAMGIGAALCACAASHATSLGTPPAAPAVAPRSVASACSGARVRALALHMAVGFWVPGCFHDLANAIGVEQASQQLFMFICR